MAAITPEQRQQACRHSVMKWLKQPRANDVRFFFPKTSSELWANSEVLSDASPYFKDMLSSLFKEGRFQNATTSASTAPSVANSEALDDVSGSDDERDFVAPPAKAPAKSTESHEFHEVIIQHASHHTYSALLLYIYAAEIPFATPPAPTQSASALYVPPHSAPSKISPKSLFRLAHYVALPELSTLCLKEIERRLTPENAAAELFGDLAQIFDEVQDIVMEYVVKNWEVIKSSKGMLEVEEREGGAAERKIAIKLAKRLQAPVVVVPTPNKTQCPCCGFWAHPHINGGRKYCPNCEWLEQPSANDVRFYFPKTTSELWANSESLSEASPYFKDMLSSAFKEGKRQNSAASNPLAAASTSDGATAAPSSSEGLDDPDDEYDRKNPPNKVSFQSPETHQFHEVIIKHTSHSTYAALLLYIYTSELPFTQIHISDRAPCGQSSMLHTPAKIIASRRSRQAQTPPARFVTTPTSTTSSTTSRISPKSLYRLAHYVAIPTLSALCLKEFEKQLTPETAAAELFGDLAQTFDEVADVMVKYVANNWDAIKRSQGMQEVEKSGAGNAELRIALKLARRLQAPQAAQVGMSCYHCALIHASGNCDVFATEM
ncbi:hypothetical protein RQP46_004305 [Phenoliferia psychrophenolica]